ncbi:MAG: type II secretion system protein [Patescibacteria group bacterium]|nr:type II secretion system protein [Patescibacteria group bacterium]
MSAKNRKNTTTQYHAPLVAGFTLIEIMVSVSIFVIVALIATGAFITANRVNKKAQAIKLVMDNLNFAVDSMVIKMRQGGAFYCLDEDEPSDSFGWIYNDGEDCGSDGRGFGVAFVTPRWDAEGHSKVVYRFNEDSNGIGAIQLWQEGGAGIDTDGHFVDITSRENMDIEYVNFGVSGTPSSGTRSVAKLVLVIEGTATVAGETSSFALQTTVSERQ